MVIQSIQNSEAEAVLTLVPPIQEIQHALFHSVCECIQHIAQKSSMPYYGSCPGKPFQLPTSKKVAPVLAEQQVPPHSECPPPSANEKAVFQQDALRRNKNSLPVAIQSPNLKLENSELQSDWQSRLRITNSPWQ
jgi:hypothetical protein